jgi:hypothetical protein
MTQLHDESAGRVLQVVARAVAVRRRQDRSTHARRGPACASRLARAVTHLLSRFVPNPHIVPLALVDRFACSDSRWTLSADSMATDRRTQSLQKQSPDQLAGTAITKIC